MAGLSPAHDPVRDAVLHWLDRLDVAIGHGDPGTLLPLARREINRMAEGWRLLLTVHERDEEGRCQACPTGTRGRWPCQIWRMAHEQLIGEGVPHNRRTRPLRNPLGRAARALSARRGAQHDG
ncbi:hypothetical protein [Actinophytocola sp.]|uniref:hypothetical protein n=1 Tax=Actinophytocola sp. TaxID=1872138 RepID=UPI002D7E4D7D|nr:hypothetical protein [Actinophytocola sp.]HET9138204.1 hypothetical protein [Actinophytocola sp.]